MVSLPRWRRALGRPGASSTGYLVSLLIFVAVLYYGVNIGEVFFRYYRLLDEMQSQCRIAAALDDGTLRRRIQAAVQEIGLPDSAGTLVVVSRTASPREISISTRYGETRSEERRVGEEGRSRRAPYH